MPEFADSKEQGQRIFARDAADGLLEEICGVLGRDRADVARSEFELGE